MGKKLVVTVILTLFQIFSFSGLSYATSWTEADFLINPEFETSIDGWTINHLTGFGTNIEEWSSEYDGSAMIYVSGSPGVGHIAQQITRPLYTGEQIKIQTYVTNCLNFASWRIRLDDELVWGSDQEYGFNASEGDYEFIITLEQDYLEGTWFSLGAAVWPGEMTVWYKNVLINTDSAPVPEPATMLLLSTGLVGLAGTKIRRKMKK